MSNVHKYPEQKGLNLTDGGDGTLGFKKSKEEIAAMIKRHTGRKASDYQKKVASEIHRGNKWNLGRKQTPETIEKRMRNRRGQKDSEKTRKAKQEAQLKHRGIPILVYDLNGNLIGEYPAIEVASRELKMAAETIVRHLNKKFTMTATTKYHIFIFKYKNDAAKP